MNDLEFEQVLINYLTASDDQKKDLDHQIDRVWTEMYTLYNKLCVEDLEYQEVHKQIKKIHHIMEFSIYSAYSGYTHPEEYENIEDAPYEFQEEKYKKHEYIASNYEKLEADLKAKLEKLKTSKFIFDREKKIKKVEDALRYYKECADEYNSCQEMLKLKEEYRKNSATMIDPIEEKYKELLVKHAKSAIEQYLDKYPMIICKQHESTWGIISMAQSKVINSLFNKLQEETVNKINAKSSKKNKRQ